MNKEMLVSVIMSTYKEPIEQVLCSVNSILEQTYQSLQLIIVIDDPANTVLIQKLEALAKSDSRISIIRNEVNCGLTASLNKALAYADGKYIARMDADDISTTERIEHQLNYMEQHNVDILGSNTINLSYEGELLNHNDFLATDEEIEKVILKTNPVAHPTWFVKSQVYDMLDGYRDIPLCEDYDFILRAYKKGLKIANIQEYLLYYRISPSGISRSNLLKQRLTSDYLAKNIDDLFKLDKDNINRYLEKLAITEKDELKYRRAAYLYQKSRANKLKNQQVKRLFYLLSCCLASKYYFKLNILSELKA